MAKVDITHPDKVLFPKGHITKQDVADYFKLVSKRMLPFLKGRPLVLERYPQGIHKPSFFQKNVQDFFPSWIKTIDVTREASTKGRLIHCDSLNTLLYVANLGCITPHIWLSKKSKLHCPDKIIFDLDPPEGKFEMARMVAYHLRDLLEKKLKLKTFVMTTGSKGLHVVVPIKPTLPFDTIREFAKHVADLITQEHPKLCTTRIRKTSRKGLVYIDVMRNAYAQHAVAPYALRATEEATVAMPISWKTLPSVEPTSFTIKTIKKHLLSNPWSSFFSSARSLKTAISLLNKLSS